MMSDWLGWVATAIVVVSYFSRKPATLRRIQGLGACLWGVYGVLIHSNPVIVANIMVVTVALGTSLRTPAVEPTKG
jgi:hypothetical protein